MTELSRLCVSFGVTAAAVLLALLFRRSKVKTSQLTTAQNHAQIIKRHRDILSMASFKGVDKVSIRSTPNARLQRVFDIDNIFTASTLERARRFKTEASHVLVRASHWNGQTKTDDWTSLIALMDRTIVYDIQRLGSTFHLDTLVRNVTLRLSIEYLFAGQVQHDLDNFPIESIATAINLLWIDSKNITDLTAPLSDDVAQRKDQLFADLQQMITFDPTDSTQNPLNLILPAYETMWRVVKMGFLELYLRDDLHKDSAAQVWIETLQAYKDGTVSFSLKDNSSKFCAKDVVKEILRLYPPARHVYRRYPGDEKDKIADIEMCQRLKPLGGEDPLVFRPERWMQIRKEFERVKMDEMGRVQKLGAYEFDLGFMPFGEACPAGFRGTGAFGFKMVALLVVALVRAAEEHGFQIEGEVPEAGTPLDADAARSRGDGRKVRVMGERKGAGAIVKEGGEQAVGGGDSEQEEDGCVSSGGGVDDGNDSD
jgi:hypothetical protein